MSCDVSGRNFEGSSCNEPADWFGSRAAICDFVCGIGEACWGDCFFFTGNVPVVCDRRVFWQKIGKLKIMIIMNLILVFCEVCVGGGEGVINL